MAFSFNRRPERRRFFELVSLERIWRKPWEMSLDDPGRQSRRTSWCSGEDSVMLFSRRWSRMQRHLANRHWVVYFWRRKPCCNSQKKIGRWEMFTSHNLRYPRNRRFWSWRARKPAFRPSWRYCRILRLRKVSTPQLDATIGIASTIPPGIDKHFRDIPGWSVFVLFVQGSLNQVLVSRVDWRSLQGVRPGTKRDVRSGLRRGMYLS